MVTYQVQNDQQHGRYGSQTEGSQTVHHQGNAFTKTFEFTNILFIDADLTGCNIVSWNFSFLRSKAFDSKKGIIANFA